MGVRREQVRHRKRPRRGWLREWKEAGSKDELDNRVEYTKPRGKKIWKTYLDLTDGKRHAGEPDKNRGMDGTAENNQADEHGQVRSEGLVPKNDGAEGNGSRQADRGVDEAVDHAFEPVLSAYAQAPSLSFCLRLSSSWSWSCLRPDTTLKLLLLLPVVIPHTLIRRIDHLHCSVGGSVYGEGCWRGCWSRWSGLGHLFPGLVNCAAAVFLRHARVHPLKEWKKQARWVCVARLAWRAGEC